MLENLKKKGEQMKNKRIIISGGGTGGHVFPAIAIANAIRELEPATEILFVGAKGKLEMEKVPEAGYEIIGLPVAGLQRSLSIKNISFFFRLIRSLRKSFSIVRDYKPDIAVGVGGYASGPLLRAASRLNTPIFIQEQNSYAGLTNKLLAPKAKKILVAYPGMEKYFPSEKIILTGNPIRQDITGPGPDRKEALEFFGLNPNMKTILVIGGSLGARTINQSIENGIEKIKGTAQVLWQSGKYYYELIQGRLKDKDASHIHLLPFIKEMKMAYAAADIIVSRAGAGTISELAIIGKPVVLVPSPNVAEDHQTKNAMALVNVKAAIHIPDNEAEKALVNTCIELLSETEKKRELSQNIKKLAIPDSAERIARIILSVE